MPDNRRTIRIHDLTWTQIQEQAEREGVSATMLILNAIADKYPALPVIRVEQGETPVVPDGWVYDGVSGWGFRKDD